MFENNYECNTKYDKSDNDNMHAVCLETDKRHSGHTEMKN